MRPKYEHMIAPFAAAAILAAIGGLSVATGRPWLVPSLGTAAFIQTMTPKVPSARPWNVVVGQLCGLGAGFAGVYVMGAQAAPAFASGHPLAWVRITAVAVAVTITVALQLLLRAENPTGGAVALLLALGAVPPNGQGAGLMLVGIALVSLLGEAARFTVLKTTTTPL